MESCETGKNPKRKLFHLQPIPSVLVLVLRNPRFHTGAFWGSWLRESIRMAKKSVVGKRRQEGKAFLEGLGKVIPALG